MAIVPFVRGAWKASPPFSSMVQEKVIYTCIATRSFREIEAEGQSVFDLIYRPVGLTVTDYETDRLNAVIIVTLEQEEGPNFMVPSSYILDYPVVVSEGFSRLVLAVELGLMSDKVSIEGLKEKMQEAVVDTIGVENAVVEIFKAPYAGVITPEMAELMEANRKSLLKTGVTAYSENKRLTTELEKAKLQIKRLEDIITAASIQT